MTATLRGRRTPIWMVNCINGWLSSLLIGFAALDMSGRSTRAESESCNRYQAVYTDANQRGFELTFHRPNSNLSPNTIASASIRYLGQPLYADNITVSNGYASHYFMGLRLDFFNADLSSPRPNSKEPPPIAFISGLGSYDYYSRKNSMTENSPPLIYETLWILDRCQN